MASPRKRSRAHAMPPPMRTNTSSTRRFMWDAHDEELASELEVCVCVRTPRARAQDTSAVVRLHIEHTAVRHQSPTSVQHTVHTLELMLQSEQDQRINAEHELFQVNESLRRLQDVMFAQDAEIKRLRTAVRAVRTPTTIEAPVSPVIAQPTVHNALPTTSTCQRPECKRRRHLLSAIRHKIDTYKQIIIDKRAQEQTAHDMLNTSDTTTQLINIKRDNERLNKINEAYQNYFRYISDAYARVFSRASSSSDS
jgi:hypothetical protein